MTCWPPARIKSGLFGSMPSAMIPTLMHAPFTALFAPVTCITWRASGSVSGWAGLPGQALDVRLGEHGLGALEDGMAGEPAAAAVALRASGSIPAAVKSPGRPSPERERI